MADEKPTKNQNETDIPGAPEVTGGSRAVPQLIRYTKSSSVEPTRPADETTEPLDAPDDEADMGSSEATPEAPAKLEAPVMGRIRREPTNSWEESENLNEHVREPADPDGIVARERSQHSPEVPIQAQKTKKRHPVVKAFIWLLVLVAATIGVYWYGSYKADKDNKQPANQVAAPAIKKPAKPAVTNTKYTSNNFSLDFSYPSNWKLTDTTSKLTIVSPATQLTNADGTTKSLRVIFAIQHKQSSLAGYPSEGAVAALASDKLTYASPSPAQRAATYVSYLGYTSADGLDAIYVTGDTGYEQGQAAPQSDITVADPLIGVSFATCVNDSCTGSVTPATLAAGKWASTPVAKDVSDIIASIQLF